MHLLMYLFIYLFILFFDTGFLDQADLKLSR